MGTFSLCIKLDKVLGNILDLRLRARLEALPCLGTKLMNLRRLGILGLIARNLMKSMNRDKDDVIILIGQLYDLMHSALVIFHSHKTTEYTHTIIYMDNIITYSKRCKVIDGELLALFHCPSDTYTVEPVEDFVVAITADLVFIINETVMEITSGHELREYSTIL